VGRHYFEPKQYFPKNPLKYRGTLPVVYRSKWELDIMKRLDVHPNVKSWESESVIIKYVSPVDGRVHRYYPDFKVELLNSSDNIAIELIEVKPYYQTIPPVFTENQRDTTKRKMAETFLINTAKWEAAMAYCEKMGWRFSLLTEREIYGKKV